MDRTALRPNRRMIAAVVLLALVATAGCIADTTDGDSGSPGAESADGQTALVEYAPAGTQALYHVDGAILRDDEMFATMDGAMAANAGPHSRTVDSRALLQRYATRAGVDLDSFGGALVFGEYGLVEAEATGGVLVRGNWTEAQFAATLDRLSEGEEDVTYETVSYADGTIYRLLEDGQAEEFEIGVVRDGLFVAGTPESVRSVLDVAAGDAQPASGPVRAAYDGTRDGLVTFVASVPDPLIEEALADAEADGPIDYAVFRDLETVSTVSYTPEGRLGSAVSLHFSNAESASTVGDGANTLLGLGATMAEEPAARAVLENTTIETDGATVSMQYETTVEAYVDLLESSAQSSTASDFGFGAESEPDAPNVAWGWTQRDGDVHITHHGGDTVEAGAIRIENGAGDVVVPADEIDRTLTAGDEITVEDGTDHSELRIVWVGDEPHETISGYAVDG